MPVSGANSRKNSFLDFDNCGGRLYFDKIDGDGEENSMSPMTKFVHKQFNEIKMMKAQNGKQDQQLQTLGFHDLIRELKKNVESKVDIEHFEPQRDSLEVLKQIKKHFKLVEGNFRLNYSKFI